VRYVRPCIHAETEDGSILLDGMSNEGAPRAEAGKAMTIAADDILDAVFERVLTRCVQARLRDDPEDDYWAQRRALCRLGWHDWSEYQGHGRGCSDRYRQCRCCSLYEAEPPRLEPTPVEFEARRRPAVVRKRTAAKTPTKE
jgi:hypothetical protein